MKTMKSIALALGIALVVALVAYVPGLHAIDGNEWWPLQTYHGGRVDVPVTATAALTASKDVAKYDVSAAGGAYIISLPASTSAAEVWADGQCQEYSMTVAGAAVSFSPSAVGDLLDATQAAYAGMDALGDSAKICYDAGTTNYYFQSRYIH
jgi:hypothetical protein